MIVSITYIAWMIVMVEKKKGITAKKYVDMQKTYNTRKSYRIALEQFFRAIKANPDTYFDIGRDYEEDVEKFANSISHLAPLSRVTKISALRGFLERNNMDFNRYFWKDLLGNKNHAITFDETPSAEDIRKILHYGNSRGRALGLTLASSGMRIGELLQLTWPNVYLENNPVKIEIPYDITKNGRPRITFISDESKEALLLWKKERSKYLEMALERTEKCLHLKKSKDDDRIFPFTNKTALNVWNNMVERAGYPYNEVDSKTNIHKYHPHSLRKFFRTQLAIGCGNTDIPEVLMGHKGYLTDSYRNLSVDELKEGYKKGIGRLLIYTNFELIKSYSSELEAQQDSMNVTIVSQANKIQNQETQHQVEMDKLYKIVNNIMNQMKETETHYEEELDKAYAFAEMRMDEELEAPEQKEAYLKAWHKYVKQNKRREKKEAAKTPEQKAEEKKKIDKQWKKLKESMQ